MDLFTFLRTLFKGPTPAMMAAQLRKPTGAPAGKVGKRMNEVNQLLYEVVLDQLRLPPAAHVLELGFGNGSTTLPLFTLATDLHYTGLDYSPAMVKAAGHTLATHIAAGRAVLHHGSSDHMPFADATFDVVFGLNTIYFWDHLDAHLNEIKRVLKPGGRFVAGYRDRTSMLALPFTQHGFNLYEPMEWETELQKAGFVQVRTIVTEEPERAYEGKLFKVRSCCTSAVRA